MTTLLIAAGGGGDALAAAIVHRALHPDEPATIASYAWDRLIIDPLPGPRSATDFDGLRQVGRHNFAFTSDTKPRGEAGSTMPRLAACLPHDLLLLDPARGSVGMHEQISELLQMCDAKSINVIDVGGDALARANEPRLRSPLADGLALSACSELPVPVTLLVAGVGLDGEVDEADVLATPGLTAVARLRNEDIAPFHDVVDWHPSEATALLAAAALGLRGSVEVRDSGLVVVLTSNSPVVSELTLARALVVNALANDLIGTVSLDEAEDVARAICGFSEIDYERRKAEWSTADRPARITSATDRAVKTFEHEAAARGIDYVTFRRIAEATLLGPAAAADLRAHLIATRPRQLAWPLWSIRPIAA